MSFICSQVLVEAYSQGNCSDTQLCVQSSTSHTPKPALLHGKTIKHSRLSRFGMTCEPLTESLGAELLMWWLEGFRARTLAQQEEVQVSQESAADCGERWHALLGRYDPVTCLWKTAQCSLLADLDECLETFPRWGSMRNGVCWEQTTWAHRTSVSASGYSPNNVDFFHTPNTNGLDGGSNSRKALKKRWATPTKWSARATHTLKAIQARQKRTFSLDLAEEIALAERFPTPQASDNRDRGNINSPCVKRRKEKGKQIMLSQSVSELNGRLNPQWVEWLMGWPIGHTGLQHLETDKYREWQQQHSFCLNTD